MPEKTAHPPRRTIKAASATSIQLVPAASDRGSFSLHNDSSADLRITYIDAATATIYDEFIPAGTAYEMPEPVFTGIINGIWTAAVGAAYISERIG